jgi:ornithine carbamoyltransferase
VNEAISDLVVTLLGTNISESCFVEVMEMVAASKTNAEKALDRDEQDAMAEIDNIYKDVKAGKGVDPEKAERAEKKRQKYEYYKEIFDKKFNNNP